MVNWTPSSAKQHTRTHNGIAMQNGLVWFKMEQKKRILIQIHGFKKFGQSVIDRFY